MDPDSSDEMIDHLVDFFDQIAPTYDSWANGQHGRVAARLVELVKPKVILAMGGTAAQSLLNTKQSLGALRNQVHRFRGIPVVVTYHPAALLRNPNWKRPTWDDVRIAARLLDG